MKPKRLQNEIKVFQVLCHVCNQPLGIIVNPAPEVIDSIPNIKCRNCVL